MDALPAEPGSSRPAMQRARGHVDIAVAARAGETCLQRLVQDGCGKARLPRIGNRACDQVVLINSSGGATGGDRLDWAVEVGAGASFTATTQACEKIYAAKPDDEPAQVSACLSVADGARLDWLPQETILYDGAKLRRTIHADLRGDARLLLVEPVIFGRSAMGEIMRHGSFYDRWRIHRDGRLIHCEGFGVADDIEMQLENPMALGVARAMATVCLFAPGAEDHLHRLRGALATAPAIRAAATAWQNKLVARFIATDGYELRQALTPVIAELASAGALPKVWAL